ncbi:hypothetical protein DICPUDRAFT_148003 [Dictyostelium purpureum]|uniref:Glycogen [starch] synthase n=1 Tax=Dictyostelium purpureum TaxID=5786 RepID=F0ZA00_DICPU|nr:uncharacterized protein DICPUDRAFT_148003 [Dictyostelium purpureum]EGC39239.1 hypothetical protein DICPUDRAFT_148003 [Dictyostelium purpureum]|eukprot:XP_003284266.1 hypothetical protein DICPUDRAFT_148003 [Dictyostelium purpureum]
MIFGTPNSTFLESKLHSSQGMTFSSMASGSGSGGLLHSSSGSSITEEVSLPPSNTVLFDISWEVAKKVGGIYTVLKSKAPVTVEEYKSRYALIGPYNSETAPTEFEPLVPGPLSSPIIENMMKKYGIQVHFGKWLVEGYPKVFLIDLPSSSHKLGEWRWDLMSGFEQPGDHETNESIVFGYQSALLLKEFAEANPNDKYIAHFHEWQASVGLILLKKWKIPVSTIFTTHATLLGRYLAAGGVDLYNQIQNLNIDYEASKRGIYHRHWIEKKSANDAHVFTTVSEITAYESESILSRKADVILPNGLKLDKFTALHEFQNLHAKYKNVLHEFVRGHFYGHYDFDLDNTLYVFTAGRSEYFNKGVDMFLDALAGLNKLLQQSGSTMTIVAFIIMPSKTNNFNIDTLKGQSHNRDLRRTCNSIVESMGERLFEATSRGRIISPEELLTQEDLVFLKRRIFALKQRPSLPPIVTHNMMDDVNDPILNHLRKIKLFNSKEDRVKIIYHPEFLNSTNPLIPLDYTEFVRGCHLGIFVSYYEPWGYTPAECTVLGVPSITSNLTGFANYMSRGLNEPESKGIFIVDRRFKSPNESVEQVTQYLWKFCQMDRRQRIELRNRTEKLSELLDWKTLGKFYRSARSLAIERAFPPSKPISRSPSPSPTSNTLKNSTSIQQLQQQLKQQVEQQQKEQQQQQQQQQTIPINIGKGETSQLSPNTMSSLLSDSLNISNKKSSSLSGGAKFAESTINPTPNNTPSIITTSVGSSSKPPLPTTTTATVSNTPTNTPTIATVSSASVNTTKNSFQPSSQKSSSVNPIEQLTKLNSPTDRDFKNPLNESGDGTSPSKAKSKSIPIPSNKFK